MEGVLDGIDDIDDMVATEEFWEIDMDDDVLGEGEVVGEEPCNNCRAIVAQ